MKLINFFNSFFIVVLKLGLVIVKFSGVDWKDFIIVNDDILDGSYFNDLDRFDFILGVVLGGIMVVVLVECVVV